MIRILLLLLLVGSPAPLQTPSFESFRVNTEELNPLAPVLDSREARRYQTVLRRGAAKGPNFAGHFTVVEWGCGTCCDSFAIVNAKTGKVWFPGYSVTCFSPMSTPVRSQATLLYKRDSSLFVVIGSRDEERPGTYYFEWKDNGLKLLKAIKDY